jgi:hypothetical protein
MCLKVVMAVLLDCKSAAISQAANRQPVTPTRVLNRVISPVYARQLCDYTQITIHKSTYE